MASARPISRAAQAVPEAHQQTEFSCGAASCFSVLSQHGRLGRDDEASLRRLLGTRSDVGTHPRDIVRLMLSRSLPARAQQHLSIRQLGKHLVRGHSLIINLQFWPEPARGYDNGHWAVVRAVDDKTVTLMDPWYSPKPIVLSHAELLARWHDQFVPKDRGGRRYQFGRPRQRFHRMAIIVRPPRPRARTTRHR
ncbi:MAG: hypothetical protein KC503_01465 [Myxococcales bacterium]|nr:hypothetical protein [Myxococcales bacterium]